jgi:uncharacterized protein (TIGR02391 family)
MPRRRQPESRPPIISLEEDKRRLEAMRDKGLAILENRPLSQSSLETWSNTAFEYIERTFGGDSRHLSTFVGTVMVRYVSYEDGRYDRFAEQQDADKLTARVKVLESLMERIDLELSFAPVAAPVTEDFWSRLHPSVVRVSRARFDAGHYADAVEAAFKELNSITKEHVRKATQECDGADLMNRAFSLNNPLVRVSDLSTEDGKNMQKGYMQIFAGAMTGIRNPKGHWRR